MNSTTKPTINQPEPFKASETAFRREVDLFLQRHGQGAAAGLLADLKGVAAAAH